MALPDYTFLDGFDKYGPSRNVGPGSLNGDLFTAMAGEWTTLNRGGNGRVIIVSPLSGDGHALSVSAGGAGSFARLNKILPTNYARIIGGLTMQVDTIAGAGYVFVDNGTDQLAISINGATGHPEVRRGSQSSGTLIATGTEILGAGSVHCLEFDITFHNTAGIVRLWIDGVLSSIDLSGIDTCATVNNYANSFSLHPVNGGNTVTVDHLYLWCYLASGGSETPALDGPVIETSITSADDTSQWTKGPGVLGARGAFSTAVSAPGANQLALIPVTAEQAANLSSIGVYPSSSSGTAKFKGVLYSDNAGAPGSLIAVGTEVIGCTASTVLTLPFSAAQALTAGTQYWIGLITDTSLNLYISNLTLVGQRKANTYTSGAPAGPLTGMTTSQQSWCIWGNLTGTSVSWPQVNDSISDNFPFSDDLEYNSSSTVGQQDYYSTTALSITTPTIHCTAVKAFMKKGDTGVRTVDLRLKSAGVESSGDTTGFALSTSYQYIGSYYWTDPATGLPFTQSALQASKIGYKIAS